MKTLEAIPDPSLAPGSAEIHVDWPGQAKPFVIRGDEETLAPLAARMAVEAASEPQTSKLPPKTAKASQTARMEATGPIYVEPGRVDKARQWFQDAHVRKFDRTHGTDLYGELQARRRKEAILLKATELHLFDSDSVYYRSQLNRLAKRVLTAG